MSDWFDPSRLNLSIDNSDDIPQKKESSQKQGEEKSNSTKNTEMHQTHRVAPAEEDILNSPISDTHKSEIKREDDIIGSIIQKQEEIQNTINNENQEKRKITDINIWSLESIISLLHEEKYEYVLIEPEDSQVKVIFRQDNIDKDIRYIKFPVYTNVLFKLKQVTKLIIENTGSAQEWKWVIKIGDFYELYYLHH